MSASLVGSEMCIRDRRAGVHRQAVPEGLRDAQRAWARGRCRVGHRWREVARGCAGGRPHGRPGTERHL
eukprot:8091577-Alexandrium_andersonii.AAC.1